MVHGQGSSQGLRQEVDVWLWQLASGVRGEGGTPPACTWGPGCSGALDAHSMDQFPGPPCQSSLRDAQTGVVAQQAPFTSPTPPS